MKKLVVFLLVTVMGFSLASCNNDTGCPVRRAAEALSYEPPRPPGQTDVVGLRVDPIPVVRIGVIGLGQRGPGFVSRFTFIEGTEIVAISDLEQPNITRTQELLRRNGRPEAAVYMGEDGWKDLVRRDDIDLVIITTHWDLHAPQAVYAMENGKHVAVDLPAALTIEECWDIVNTAERTRRHFMMLSNTTYDRFEMATLNMAQQGWFGEIVHVEGAYIHDLRGFNFRPRWREGITYEPGVGMIDTEGRTRAPSGYWDYWRLRHNAERDGSLYPTHGIAPLAQILGLGRGDKMTHMVSMSSGQFNMTQYAIDIFGADSDHARREYRKGDMNVTMIKTAKGRTMMIQHDVASPRPYSRIHMISGTQGFAQRWPRQHFAVNVPDLFGSGYRTLRDDEMRELLEEFEHPIWSEFGEMARSVGGHGGMDFIMQLRLIYCLQNGLPLDMDVYDGVSQSAIIPLSEFSVANGSFPVRIPDFTRGAWNRTQGYRHAVSSNR